MKHRLIVEFKTKEDMQSFVEGLQRDFDLMGGEELIGTSSEMVDQLAKKTEGKPPHQQIHAYPADSLDFPGHRVPGTRDISWYILRAKGSRPESQAGGQTAEGAE